MRRDIIERRDMLLSRCPPGTNNLHKDAYILGDPEFESERFRIDRRLEEDSERKNVFSREDLVFAWNLRGHSLLLVGTVKKQFSKRESIRLYEERFHTVVRS